MNKWIGLLIVIALIVAAWQWLREQRVTAPWNEPKVAKISRGDIKVPITAAGLIEPQRRIEVKSKASGEVIEIRFVEGQYVHKGETLVVLKPDDEQRTVERARASLTRAESLLESARVDVLKARSEVDRQAATLDQLKAESRIMDAEVERVRNLMADPESGGASTLERVRVEAQRDMNLAQIRAAEALLSVAQNNVRSAEESVKIQAAAVTEAQKTLEDAEERLRETTILAPEDSQVTDVKVTQGEVIQGGENTFTGGTILMTLGDVAQKYVLTRVDESDYGRVLEISPQAALPEMPGMQSAATQAAAEIQERTGAVELTVDAFPDEKFTGRIERVEPQGNLNVGSSIIQFDVRVVITGDNAAKLPLGAQAQVEFTVESATSVLRVPAEAAKTHEGERGVWLKVPPPAGSNEKHGKRFVKCRFGITDGAYTHLIEAIGEELAEDTEVYTKVPVSDDSDERR